MENSEKTTKMARAAPLAGLGTRPERLQQKDIAEALGVSAGR